MPVKFVFDADSARYPSGSFPQLKQFTTGSMVYRGLGFDDTSLERCFFQTTAPSGWSGSITACVFGFPESASSGSVVWELSVDVRAVGVAMNASSFATTSSVLVGVNGASFLGSGSLAPDDDSASPGQYLTFLLRRLTTHGSDTATGDYNFLNLVVADGS